MKKRILLSFFCLFAAVCCLEAQGLTETNDKPENEIASQSKTTKRYYMEIQGIQSPVNAKAFDIQLIPGRLIQMLSKLTAADLRNFCSSRQINGMSDAMNHLSLLGWTLQDCYATAISGNVCTHWIVYKDAVNIDELVDGLLSK